MKTSQLRTVLLVAIANLAVLPAVAQVVRPAGYFVQGGIAEEHAWNATAGVVWPWAWRASVMGTELSAITEAYVSHWDSRTATGRRSFVQVGVVPLVRLRLEQGRSPWFLEAGIGLSLLDHKFETETKRFTTSFNFVDVVGVGRSFGSARQQELGLRLQHVSNAGIKAPNPGQNFVQLRYASSF